MKQYGLQILHFYKSKYHNIRSLLILRGLVFGICIGYALGQLTNFISLSFY